MRHDFHPRNMAVKDGQTLSATRFAQLTGMSRERLRTWERRYGFPEPRRGGPGARRYAAWGGHVRQVSRSSLFRVPAAPGEAPLVAMLGLEGDAEQAARAALAAQRREVEELRHTNARHARWLEALALLAATMQHEPEPEAAIAGSLDVLVRLTEAVDAGLAAHSAGRLVLERSHRGMFGAGAVTVAAHPQL